MMDDKMGQRWTFVIDGVVVEFSRSVFHGQPVPQREVIDGEQVVFISWSQELPVKWKFSFRQLLLETELHITDRCVQRVAGCKNTTDKTGLCRNPLTTYDIFNQ